MLKKAKLRQSPVVVVRDDNGDGDGENDDMQKCLINISPRKRKTQKTFARLFSRKCRRDRRRTLRWSSTCLSVHWQPMRSLARRRSSSRATRPSTTTSSRPPSSVGPNAASSAAAFPASKIESREEDFDLGVVSASRPRSRSGGREGRNRRRPR